MPATGSPNELVDAWALTPLHDEGIRIIGGLEAQRADSAGGLELHVDQAAGSLLGGGVVEADLEPARFQGLGKHIFCCLSWRCEEQTPLP